jgi:hypothetical protein
MVLLVRLNEKTDRLKHTLLLGADASDSDLARLADAPNSDRVPLLMHLICTLYRCIIGGITQSKFGYNGSGYKDGGWISFDHDQSKVDKPGNCRMLKVRAYKPPYWTLIGVVQFEFITPVYHCDATIHFWKCTPIFTTMHICTPIHETIMHVGARAFT